jgi:hypothetical protein
MVGIKISSHMTVRKMGQNLLHTVLASTENEEMILKPEIN